jgi:hypothetical protein
MEVKWFELGFKWLLVFLFHCKAFVGSWYFYEVRGKGIPKNAISWFVFVLSSTDHVILFFTCYNLKNRTYELKSCN